MAALAGQCFGEDAIGPAHQLTLYRALVVQYDAAAGLTHQEVHRDHSLLSCVITLNERSEYAGGGTWVEALDEAFTPPRGHGVLQAASLRHSGQAIDAGERWVLVFFLMGTRMARGEHVRYLKTQAHRLMDAGEYERMHLYSVIARQYCGDSDHELLCNQVRERGVRSGMVACTTALGHAEDGHDRHALVQQGSCPTTACLLTAEWPVRVRRRCAS